MEIFIILIGFIVILILWIIRGLLLIVDIQGQSMTPFLIPGDRVLVLRYWPIKWIRKGQVVVFFPPIGEYEDNVPPAFTKHVLFVKRIIGVSGDTVSTSLLDLPEFERASLSPAHDEMGKRVWNIPPKHFFAKGDSFGTDSLTWGPIPNDRLVGIVIMRLSRVRKDSDGFSSSADNK
jgi:signal peptidase I